MTADQLEEEFAPRGRRRGGVLFLDSTAALDLIKAARQYGIRVLGVDQFRLEGDVVHASLDNLNLSDHRPSNDPWSEAERFIDLHAGAGAQFEVVLGEWQEPRAEPPRGLILRLADWDFTAQVAYIAVAVLVGIVVIVLRAC